MKGLYRAAVLSFLILTMVGCGSGSAEPENISADNASAASGTATAFPAVNPDSANSDIKSEPVSLTYFGNREISEVSALFSKNTGGTVNIESGSADYTAYTEKLSEKISSDSAPDLCDKIDNTYPYLISKNLYENLTDYIDVTSPQWAGYVDIIEAYSFKGGHYFYPTCVTAAPDFLIYNKNAFVKCGVSDPEMLWKNNEWTWSAFINVSADVIMDEQSEENALIGGKNIFENFLTTTGENMFFQNGPLFENCLTSSNSVRVHSLLSNYMTDYSDNIESDFIDFVNGESDLKPVFISGDERMLIELRKTNQTVGAVPFPRDEESEKYYCSADCEGFLVPKGAKNIQAAASFINLSRISNSAEEHKASIEKSLRDSGLLRSDIEWLENFRSSDKMSPLPVETQCLDEAGNAAVKNILVGGADWDNALADNAPIIDEAIDGINAVIE